MFQTGKREKRYLNKKYCLIKPSNKAEKRDFLYKIVNIYIKNSEKIEFCRTWLQDKKESTPGKFL